MASQFDITIVGGGMVGLAMAASLAEHDFKILLVEKQDLASQLSDNLLVEKPLVETDFAVRVSAISPGNISFLKKINGWQNIPQVRLASYEKMSVWDGDGTGKIEFSANKIAAKYLGVIAENRIIQAALLKKIQSYGNVHCCFTHQVDTINHTEDNIEITLSDHSLYKSQLLIAADGAQSKIRQLAGIELKQSNYDQVAFVANVKTEHHHQNTAWQRFTPSGPVAFLPLALKNYCSVVWTLDNEKAESIADLDKEQFASRLQHAFESKLGRVTAVTEHFGFPLIKRHAQSYLADRIALIGDAAHTIHPLAGQGVNIGFQDVVCLSELLIKLKQQQRDFGLSANLRPFERERKSENLIMQNAMSGFKHLFANQTLPVTLLRNFAMSALDNADFIKEAVINKAMGI